MIKCDSCGEMLPDETRFCPVCGAGPMTAPAETTEEKPAPDTDTEAAEPLDADDGWRPLRYERPVRTRRAQSRSTREGEPTLRVLAIWLAAVIVIAAGVFWYIWTGNDAPAQPVLTKAITYRSEASLARLTGLAPDFSRFSRL